MCTMSITIVEDAVRRAVEQRDLSSLVQHLAEDVEVVVRLDVAGTTHRECRGREAATAYLAATRDVATLQNDSHEVFGTDERIVAVVDQSVATGPGLAVRGECVLVLDLRGNAITRLAIHHELKPVLHAPAPAGDAAAEAQVRVWSDAA
jgi:ketosteroid isomerase-like protein